MLKQKEFSHALAQSLYGKKDREQTKIVERAIGLLQKYGQERMIPAILKETVRLIENKNRAEGAEVLLAREEDGSKFRDQIAGDLASLGVMEYKTVIRDSVIGGYQVRGNGVLLDRSVRKNLIDLYQNMTR